MWQLNYIEWIAVVLRLAIVGYGTRGEIPEIQLDGAKNWTKVFLTLEIFPDARDFFRWLYPEWGSRQVDTRIGVGGYHPCQNETLQCISYKWRLRHLGGPIYAYGEGTATKSPSDSPQITGWIWTGSWRDDFFAGCVSADGVYTLWACMHGLCKW